MGRKKEAITAAGTLACALGIGFAMQSTDAADKHYGDSYGDSKELTPEVAQSAPQDLVSSDTEIAGIEDVVLTSAYSPVVTLEPEIAKTEPVVVKQASVFQSLTPKAADATDECAIQVQTTALPAAFVSLSIAAGCHANQAVTIHHGPVTFRDVTDFNGNLDLTVPALERMAVFNVEFEDDASAIAMTKVDTLQNFKRIVLHWEGDAGFELHAREDGAQYGAEGHVWRGAFVSDTALQEGRGGYLSQLGNRFVADAKVAEVYTLPADLSRQSNRIDLSIEARVTSANCGKDISAQVLEIDDLGGAYSRTVSLSVPGCDALDEYLVLNNVLEDLKLAAR